MLTCPNCRLSFNDQTLFCNACGQRSPKKSSTTRVVLFGFACLFGFFSACGSDSTAEESHSSLVDSYRALIVSAEPRCKGIKARAVKTNNGYDLWAEHPYFTRYQLSGSTGPAVKQWLNSSIEELRRARITRVGLRDAAYSEDCTWYNVK